MALKMIHRLVRIPFVLRLLLRAGADANMRDPDGTTLLHKAILEGGRPELVRVLLGGGADPNLQTSNGWTAFILPLDVMRPKARSGC